MNKKLPHNSKLPDSKYSASLWNSTYRWMRKNIGLGFVFTACVWLVINSAYTEWEIRKSFISWHGRGKDLVLSLRKVNYFCKNVKNRNHLTEVEQNKLLQYNDILDDRNLVFINEYAGLGMLVNEPTYKAIHELACWADYIGRSSGQICALDLKDYEKISAWSDEILQSIVFNAQEHKQLFKMVVNLFKSFVSDPRSQVRPKSKCDIDKISKNIDSKFGNQPSTFYKKQ